jgi:hypothetical protein
MSMEGVDDERYTASVSSEPSEGASLGKMRVNDDRPTGADLP